jgi:anti-anti-sigma factor
MSDRRTCHTSVLDMPVVSTPHFTISTLEAAGGVLRVCLAGEFDMSVGDALRQALTDAARRPGASRVIVDLQRTTLIDSHAIAGLVHGYEVATAAGVGYSVVNGHGLVEEVLNITGLAEVFRPSGD